MALTFNKLPNINQPDSIVFSDFDSTYFNHLATELELINIQKFDLFLSALCERENILFGFISGAPKKYIIDHLKDKNYNLLPHFIASSYGSEIHYYDKNQLILDQEWDRQFPTHEQMEEKLLALIHQLKHLGLELIYQGPWQQTHYKRSFFLSRETHPENQVKAILTEHCPQYNLTFNISHANPDNGDSGINYDVDFFPAGCGKDKIVAYLCDKFSVQQENTIAFGDSGNDLAMLQSVQHGYLVANATAEAKAKFPHHLDHSHTKGIYQGLLTHYREPKA